MNHPFDLDNFESFLSEQADQHRMYAGDRVWRNIQENLHGRDRWPALTFGAILTTAVMAVVLTFTYPQKRLYNEPADFSGILPRTAVSHATIAGRHDGRKQAKLPAGFVAQAESEQATMITPLFAETYTGEVQAAETAPVATDVVTTAGSPAALAEVALENTGNPATTVTEPIKNTENSETDEGLPARAFTAFRENYNPSITAGNLLTAGPEALQQPNSLPLNGTGLQNTLQESHETMARNSFIKTTMAYGPAVPEKSMTRRNRWSVQFYATPSISYRYLLENKTFTMDPAAANGPIAPYLTNPARDFITQKPKLGLEAGTAFLYSITDNFRLRTGLQVNYRQFGLQAFTTNAQPAMLTLNRQNGLDSIVRFSSLSTQSGYKSIELSNNFFQVAIPLGFDMRIADTRSVDFYVAAAGQLTYQVKSNNYLLSADYKNFLRQPDLERKFNINTAVEAFASFEAGGITWQAGPQIRYQVLPGSKNAYPIREHLIDYGFKIGVVKKLK